MNKLIKVMLCTTILSGCGGGGGSGDGGSGGVPPTTGTGQCAVAAQNQSLLSYLQDHYYWYQDIPNLNAANFANPYDLLEAAKSPLDRFSFMLTEDQYHAVFTDANMIGYGFSHRLSVDRQSLEVRYVYDNGPSKNAGWQRGDKVTAVDGVSVLQLANDVQAGIRSWNGIFGDSVEGASNAFTWTKSGGESFTETLVKTVVDTNTVLASEVIPLLDKQVGYLVFNSFVERAKDDLNVVFDQFAAQNVQEVILDLRYNGGGQISVANQLSTQIAGLNVDNQVFVNFEFNDKHPENNSTSLFALGEGIKQLDLDRLIVLTTSGSCSASEMVINSLSPFIDVVTIGETTCGKPVGMSPVQICDKFIFAINFETTNALGVGGYFDGMTPQCFAQDKIVADWGNVNDPLLREGLHYIDNNQCFSANKGFSKQPLNLTDFSQGPVKARNDQ